MAQVVCTELPLRLANFITKYYPVEYSKEEMIKAVKGHLEYGTIDWIEDKKGFIYVMRYNVDDKCFHILDLVIRPDKRGLKTMKFLIARNWSFFPHLREYSFERLGKYADRDIRTYKLRKTVKESKNGRK